MIITYDYSKLNDITFIFETKKHYKICQNVMTMDTETSNGLRDENGIAHPFEHDRMSDENYQKFVKSAEKVSITYMWQYAIDNENEIYVFLGRTVEELREFLNSLTLEIKRQAIFGFRSINRSLEIANAQKNKMGVKILNFIHNYSFDFQILCNLFANNFSKCGKHASVFARTLRRPMKTSISLNKVSIETRDSYVLTQKSLAKWGKDANLTTQKIKVEKDYYLKIRTPISILSQDEIDYAVTDVVTMIEGLRIYKSKYQYLENIPLTQTGEIRRVCVKNVAEADPVWVGKCQAAQNMDFDLFQKLVKCFAGGWVHANALHANKLIDSDYCKKYGTDHVSCFDFASSYPAVMCTRRYPITPWKKEIISDFDKIKNNSDLAFFGKIRFKNVAAKKYNTYISLSKCENIISPLVDNGRILRAKSFEMYLTDLDFDIISNAYNFEFEVLELYSSEYDYLPESLIRVILHYYKYKTSLKDVVGSESMYNESKQFVNSIYGCSVTKILTDTVMFKDSEWLKFDATYDDYLEVITQNKTPWITYSIGVWVTAHARHNLWDFILKFDDKIIYGDTDSIKAILTDEDIDFINTYNDNIKVCEDKVINLYNLPADAFTPKTPKGKEKRLGIMAREEDCEEFATLGAKRYVAKYFGESEIHCTIAGLPKEAGSNKIKKVSDFLDPNLCWDTRESQKQCVYYNDNQSVTKWIDEDGLEYVNSERFGACVLPTSFDFSLSDDYQRLIEALDGGVDVFNDTPDLLI